MKCTGAGSSRGRKFIIKNLSSLFRRFLTRPPDTEETKALQSYLTQQVERLKKGVKTFCYTNHKGASSELAGKVLLAGR